MAVFGMRRFLFFKDQFTVGLEFRLRVLLDFVRYDLGMGRYGKKCRELEEYPKAMYQFLMNSSMICFLDASTGNFIAYETTLPWQQHEVKTWYRIDIFPDHQLQLKITSPSQQDLVDFCRKGSVDQLPISCQLFEAW